MMFHSTVLGNKDVYALLVQKQRTLLFRVPLRKLPYMQLLKAEFYFISEHQNKEITCFLNNENYTTYAM